MQNDAALWFHPHAAAVDLKAAQISHARTYLTLILWPFAMRGSQISAFPSALPRSHAAAGLYHEAGGFLHHFADHRVPSSTLCSTS